MGLVQSVKSKAKFNNKKSPRSVAQRGLVQVVIEDRNCGTGKPSLIKVFGYLKCILFEIKRQNKIV